jgi:YD repeat-containing protein
MVSRFCGLAHRMFRRGRVAVLAAPLMFSGVGAVWAQSDIQPPLPLQSVDAMGVEVSNGTVQVSSPTISIGDPANGGLSYTATWDTGVRAWRSSVWGGINKATIRSDPYCYAYITVTSMGQSGTFQQDTCTGGYELKEGLGALTRTGNIWTYTAPDGSISTYDYAQRTGMGAKFSANQGIITSITRPNGEVISFAWVGLGNLRSVSNNYGYQLYFAYDAAGLSSVTALNNAVDACAPTAETCSFSTNWPSLTFSGLGNERRVQDALGRMTRLIFDAPYDSVIPQPKLVGVARPTRASGSSITYAYTSLYVYGSRVTAASDGVATWTYAYEPRPCQIFDPGNTDPNYCPEPEYDYSVATTVSGPLGTKAVYHFNWMHPTFSLGEVSHALYAITDGLNRDWGVNVDGGGLRSVGYPEGNTTTYYRDLITGALTETVSVPKSDSGLSNLSVTLSYPACTGSNAIACRRPTSSTDKRGKVTDYIYDAAGNLVTETAPAPTPGAVRPQTRRTWEQRYAWYKQNGSSAITQATSPIWVLTETSECRTTASCTGAADERKSTITYQVGSSGVASNLLPLTKSVGAGSGSPWNTTTYTYTPLGDVSTVDGPLSGAADKTRTFYDAMRQVVGGVGPDPDGGGSLKYRATRTTYNADGQVTLSETGTTTDQSDTAMSTFQALTFKRNTYDATTGRLIKTEEGQP